MSLLGEDEESGSIMTPVARSSGRLRCYAPIPHPPQLPELSERVQTCLENGKYLFRQRNKSLIFIFLSGQAAQVLQDFINETADFFMRTYPQLKTGREYRKIGLALIKKYPCLAEKGNHLKPEVRHEIFLIFYSLSFRLYYAVNCRSKCVICVKKFELNPVEWKKMIIAFIKTVSLFFLR